MYNFSDISIITHVRIDTDERAKNAIVRDIFYNKYCYNLEFVYIEDDTDSKLPNILNNIDIYKLYENSSETKKSMSYNIGSTLTDRKYYCFLDLDCIVHPEQILRSVEYIKNDANIGLLYPFNGVALYLSEKMKEIFSDTVDYDILHNIIPSTIYVDYENDNLLVGSISAPGGCIIAREDNFIKFKGFNPFFVGWGFEDNEIQTRVKKLGYVVSRLAGDNDLLWHLPHYGNNASKKETNKHYNDNNRLYNFINSADKEAIIEHMRKW